MIRNALESVTRVHPSFHSSVEQTIVVGLTLRMSRASSVLAACRLRSLLAPFVRPAPEPEQEVGGMSLR